MTLQASKPDLDTLIYLAERKARETGGYLTIYRTEYQWRVAPCQPDEIEAVAGYESLLDALTHFIIGEAN